MLLGTIVFAAFGGVYFWFPKMTGRLLDERLGNAHFWTMFVGFHATFLVQHWLGDEGMPRRYSDYQPQDGITMLNTISSIGTLVLGASTLFFVYNVWKSWRYGAMVSVDDPWGFGNSLEWATTCPQEFHQELHHEKRSPESPSAAGAHGAREATDYQPAPQSGARPVEVPEPEQIRRPSFEHTDAPDEDGNPLDSDRGAPTDERWRHPHSRGENEER